MYHSTFFLKIQRFSPISVIKNDFFKLKTAQSVKNLKFQKFLDPQHVSNFELSSKTLDFSNLRNRSAVYSNKFNHKLRLFKITALDTKTNPSEIRGLTLHADTSSNLTFQPLGTPISRPTRPVGK